VAKGPFFEDFYQCVTHGFYTEKWQEQMYGMMSFVLMFVLPLAVLICTYFSTVFTIARKYTRTLSSQNLADAFSNIDL